MAHTHQHKVDCAHHGPRDGQRVQQCPCNEPERILYDPCPLCVEDEEEGDLIPPRPATGASRFELGLTWAPIEPVTNIASSTRGRRGRAPFNTGTRMVDSLRLAGGGSEEQPRRSPRLQEAATREQESASSAPYPSSQFGPQTSSRVGKSSTLRPTQRPVSAAARRRQPSRQLPTPIRGPPSLTPSTFTSKSQLTPALAGLEFGDSSRSSMLPPLGGQLQTMHGRGSRLPGVRSIQQSSSEEKNNSRKWTESEDNLIIQLREDEGMKWEDISRRMDRRSATACRLRYQNYIEKERLANELAIKDSAPSKLDKKTDKRDDGSGGGSGGRGNAHYGLVQVR